MKLNKSTTALVNLVLILACLFLIKTLVGSPVGAYASSPADEYSLITGYPNSDFEKKIAVASSQGWAVVGFGVAYTKSGNTETYALMRRPL